MNSYGGRLLPDGLLVSRPTNCDQLFEETCCLQGPVRKRQAKVYFKVRYRLLRFSICVYAQYCIKTGSKLYQGREGSKLTTFRNAAICSILLVSLCGGPICAQQKASSGPAESCRRFVQQFYSWYVARSKKAGGEDLILTKKRASFSSKLVRRLKEDRLAANRSPGEIVGLDFDPVLNAQDVAQHYVMGKVTSKGGLFRAEVYGIWNGKKGESPDVVPELKRKGKRWIFVNFYYPSRDKTPKDDLLHVLANLKRERLKNAKK